MKRKYIVYLFVFILLCIAVDFSVSKIYHSTKGLSISDQGATGDAFNGFLTPFIGILSALLIYYTFREQNRANILLSSQNQFDTYFKLFAEMEKSVKNLRHNTTIHDEHGIKHIPYEYRGQSALVAFVAEMQTLPADDVRMFLKQYALVLEDFVLLFEMVNSSKMQNKLYFIRRLENYYFVTLKDEEEKLRQKLLKDLEGFEYFYDLLTRSEVSYTVCKMKSDSATENELYRQQIETKEGQKKLKRLIKRKEFYDKHPRLRKLWDKYRNIRWSFLLFIYDEYESD